MLPKTITEVVASKLAEVSEELSRTKLKVNNLDEIVKSYDKRFGELRHKTCVVITHNNKRAKGGRQGDIDGYFIPSPKDSITNYNAMMGIYQSLTDSFGLKDVTYDMQ